MVANTYVVLDKLESNENLESINDSGDQSDYNYLFSKAQRGMDDFFPRSPAEFWRRLRIPSIEQAGKTGSVADWETDEEGSTKEARVFKREGKSEETEDVRDKEMESEDKGHDLAPVSSARHSKGAMKSGFALAFLRTCRQVYAEASPLFYSMVVVVITPHDVVDPHDKEEIIGKNVEMDLMNPEYMRRLQHTGYEEGIFETLGLASLLDFAAFTRFERICFEAEYRFRFIDDSPSLYVDKNLHTSSNDEAELISFMKRTRTVENFVSLLATLPRVRQLALRLVIEVRAQIDFSSDDGEDDEADRVDFEKMDVANERATELFIEYGILDPLRKLSNVQNFELDVQTAARENDDEMDFMVLKPKHLRMAEDLKEAIEHNWTARSSIHR